MSRTWEHVTGWAARECGKPRAFVMAATVIAVWGLTGPVFQYSDTWQLIINTGTTVVTFLLGFLLLARQTHDAAAVQAKLDVLIGAMDRADNRLIAAEDLDEKRLNELRTELRR